MVRQPSLIYSRCMSEYPYQSYNKKRLHRLIKRCGTLDMWAVSTAGKNLLATLAGAPGLLCMGDRNHRVGISPHDQHWDTQPRQGIEQIDALPSTTESSLGGCNQCLVCAGLRALLVELVYQRLLKQVSLGKEVSEFGAQALLRRLGAHQIE